MPTAGVSLTGLWHGQFSYPSATSAPVPFSASLVDTEGLLGGSITERATIGRLNGRTLLATIRGERSYCTVAFLKLYEPNNGAYRTVTYAGTLSEDGLEIDGDWCTEGWSGRFLMVRARGLPAAAARRAVAKV